ncbi:hypothetical protein [Mycoplasma sp. HU2014]|uniref:hypothetical protein n=1 Tax=Mycoplasma sp. HU2014 TaxID=1664275 RepID=UPI0006A44BD5|nr:hypothetical protein [Mycoplasma sp. HU2014]KNG79666.1 membrane protein [Mycoplasma sp. HU2014]
MNNYDIKSRYQTPEQSSMNFAISMSKTWIIFLQIVGSVLAVIGLVSGMVFFNSLDYNTINPKYKLGVPVLFSILSYSLWRTISTAFVIVRFLKQATNEQIVSNRYILASLSLNLGGFFTPWLLTSLPNIETNSTIKPKWFLSRVFSVITLVGFAILLVALLLQLNKVTGGNISSAFNKTNPYYSITIVLIFISVLFILVGVPSIALYYNKNSEEQFEDDTSTSTTMRIFAYFYLVVTTIELFIVMWLCLLRLVGGFSRLINAFDNDGGINPFAVLFALIYIIFQITYVLFLWRMIVEVIKGIWKRDGIIKLSIYDKLKAREKMLRAK